MPGGFKNKGGQRGRGGGPGGRRGLEANFNRGGGGAGAQSNNWATASNPGQRRSSWWRRWLGRWWPGSSSRGPGGRGNRSGGGWNRGRGSGAQSYGGGRGQ